MKKQTVLLLVLALAFFSFLGSRGLNEPDEGRYAEIGREIVASGDWITPHLNGFEHFQKPPLLYWTTALSFKCFGLNEWAARLPSTLAALGTVVLTAWMAAILWGRPMALPTALVLSSSFLFFSLARFLTPDMLMTFFITSAMACLVQSAFNPAQKSRSLWRWGFFIAMGLGFLTKGPMALVVPISAALALRQGLRSSLTPLSLPWLRGLVLTLSLGFSWFLVMVWKYPELGDYFLGYELLKRFGSHAHGRSEPFWYFVPVMMAGFLPWIFFVPKMLFRFRQCIFLKKKPTPSEFLILGWIVPPFLILSLSGSKLPTYILPLLPAMALGVVHGWNRQNYSFSSLRNISLGSIALLLLAFSQADPWNHFLGRQASIRSLALQINELQAHGEGPVFSAGMRAHGLEFYLGQTVSVCRADADLVLKVSPLQEKRLFDSVAEMEKAMVSRPTACGLIRIEEWGKSFPRSSWKIIATAGDFALVRPRDLNAALEE